MTCKVNGCLNQMKYPTLGICQSHYSRLRLKGDVLADIPVARWNTRRHELTNRECETLKWIAMGKTNRCTALEMGITIKTVEKHRQSLMRALNIHSTAELTHFALAKGLVKNIYETESSQRPQTGGAAA